MTKMDKVKLVFLTIISFGFIWFFINKKTVIKTELSKEDKVLINIKKLKMFIGEDNITNITNTQQRVKIEFKERGLVNTESINKMNGISGILTSSNSIIIIVGKSAEAVKNKLKNS